MINQVYFCLSIMLLAIALSVGLISGIHFRPPEIHNDWEIYRFATVVFFGISLFITIVIFYLRKFGYWEKIINRLIEKEDAKDEKE